VLLVKVCPEVGLVIVKVGGWLPLTVTITLRLTDPLVPVQLSV
jgi:hypothetical protein